MKTIIGKDTERAAALLEKGEIVAIPTETVYGLAGNALNEEAVLKIYKAKNRPRFNPLIIHLAHPDQIPLYTTEIPDKIRLIAKYFMPGPLTVLLNKKDTIPDLVTAGSSKVAIRIPSHPLTHELLQKISFPLAAPSANPSGYVSPTSAQHVFDSLHGEIPYILDGGECKIGLESTIIAYDEKQDQVILHRAGGTPVEDLEGILKEKLSRATSLGSHPETPGQLKSHYATATPLYVGNIPELIHEFKGKKIGVISFNATYPETRTFMLSPKGNLGEAAKNLFRTLRTADKGGFDVLLAEQFPDQGIGEAINDRLHRAQAIYK